jgi:hypothetical protein
MWSCIGNGDACVSSGTEAAVVFQASQMKSTFFPDDVASVAKYCELLRHFAVLILLRYNIQNLGILSRGLEVEQWLPCLSRIIYFIHNEVKLTRNVN